MTNIMKEKPIAAINERASTFVSKCAEAGRQSVDVYVSQNHPKVDMKYAYHIPSVSASLLRIGLRHSFYVQSRRT
jgi:hypothetical protein